MTSQTKRSQVFQISLTFCLGCAGERIKRRFLISNVSTDNIKLCHRQLVGHGYELIGPAFGSLFIYSVQLDWYPVAGDAGRKLQVALTKDRKKLPIRRRQQISSKHWYLYTGIHGVVS